MTQRRILVTGASGQLGDALCRQLGPAAIGLSRRDVDLAHPGSITPLFERFAPQVVINCAAYTRVDSAEEYSDECFRINATAVNALAAACDRIAATLVQVSTDYVFSGSLNQVRPFVEEDQPKPQGIYARSKLAGERAASACQQHLIVRTSGLYGLAGDNFVSTMLRLSCEQKPLRVVDDQHCTPSYIEHVAKAICFLLESDQRGLFHVVNGGSTTWYDFACEIFRQVGILRKPEPISSAQYNAAAPRPVYSVLDCSRYQQLDGPKMPHWQVALAEYLSTCGLNAGMRRSNTNPHE